MGIIRLTDSSQGGYYPSCLEIWQEEITEVTE